MHEIQIGVMKGDFIGPEVMNATLPIVEQIGQIAGKDIELVNIPAGGDAYEQTGEHLPDSSIRTAESMDAILKGPFGGPPNSDDPKWQDLEHKAILPLRKKLNLYADLRPAKTLSNTCSMLSPLKPEFVKGVDIMFVRELTGGIYFGESGSKRDRLGQEVFYETEEYKEPEVVRIVTKAVEVAQARSGKLALIHKKNVLKETGGLWNEVFYDLAESAGLETQYFHADNAASFLLSQARDLDTVVTTNMFGDILSEEAIAATGSLGLGPSASMRTGKFGLYGPGHGSAPDIGGKNMANPVGMILSAAMMFRHSFDMPEEAELIESAVTNVLDAGRMTFDLWQTAAHSNQRISVNPEPVTTSDFGKLVLSEVNRLSEG
jgi:3-isopropylmalate dehydrogenase